MKFEELEKAAPEALWYHAKECFEHAKRPQIMGDTSNVSALLEAQFYLGEIERRKRNAERDEDNAYAERSHQAETRIIWLIVLELVIAAVTLGYTIYEGRSQAKAMAAIQRAAENTATAAQNTANMVILMQSRMAVPFIYQQAPSTAPKSSSKIQNRTPTQSAPSQH